MLVVSVCHYRYAKLPSKPGWKAKDWHCMHLNCAGTCCNCIRVSTGTSRRRVNTHITILAEGATVLVSAKQRRP